MFEFNMPVAFIPPEYRDFLPSLTTPAVNAMVAEYQDGEAEMRRMHTFMMADKQRSALLRFAEGAAVYFKSKAKRDYWALDLIDMFDLTRAICASKETYWFKLFDMCSLTQILPSDLWEQWKESFEAWRTVGKDGTKATKGIPLFDTESVYRVLTMIEAHRANFLSMRVDALWRSLSPVHKTNFGSGFHKRFIINQVYNEHGNTAHKLRAIMDLVNLCSTVMTGADDPFFDTEAMLTHARKKHCGEWVEVMGGQLNVRAYQVGTLHVEVHPDIASRLNIALAYLHPNGLTDKLAIKPQRRKSGFGAAELVRNAVPDQVRSYLRCVKYKQREDGLWAVVPGVPDYMARHMGGVVKGMIEDVLSQVGGKCEENIHLFDYHPKEVIEEIVKTGEVPNKVSYQFYSTPPELAAEFVKWVGISDTAMCYETSAGTGAIAKQMPLQTHCIEVDRLRAMALDKMGFEVTHADFLALKPSDIFGEADCVLMNPPFADRAWQDHFLHAVRFVRDGGIIGAILPEGAPLKMPHVEGLKVVYSAPKKNQFPDASIEVVFAKWVKAATTPDHAVHQAA
ncbi:DUF4942 domain-containing protein [Pseudomonas tritici]|uniref:DUF4942 domain-containing protein n=1 Tax=Pseudomonas tritici TaxID=2745518 RepID=UPI00387AF242